MICVYIHHRTAVFAGKVHNASKNCIIQRADNDYRIVEVEERNGEF